MNSAARDCLVEDYERLRYSDWGQLTTIVVCVYRQGWKVVIEGMGQGQAAAGAENTLDRG